MVSPTIVVTSEEQPAIQVVVTEENVVVISDQLPALSAAQSAAAALVSQQAAAASEVAAAASEDAAALSATAADASEAAALASQVAAAASESSAALSAGTATTQAGIATTQAGIATSAASTATTQAGIATTQASAASTSAAAALLSQNSATSSASAALASQNAASASAAAALVSQNSAAASAAAAAQSVIDLTTAISGGTLAASFTTLKASEHIALAATKKLYLDGIAATGDTYLVESSANVLDVYAGGIKSLSLTAAGITQSGDLSAINLQSLTNSAASYANTNNFLRFLNSAGNPVGGLTHPAVTTLGVWGNTGVRVIAGSSGATTVAEFTAGSLAVTGTLSATGTTYARGYTASPLSGEGVEIDYGAAGAGIGRVLAYDRTAAAAKALQLAGLTVDVKAGAGLSTVATFSSNGLSLTGAVSVTKELKFTTSNLGTASDYYIGNYLTNLVYNAPTGGGHNWAINNADKMTLNATSLTLLGIANTGDVVSTSGGVGLRIRYGATDFLNIFGSMYSSAATMLGYGVRSSTAASNTFLSTSAAASHPRGALVMDNALHFYQANSSLLAVGATATLNEAFTITTNGDQVTPATKKHYFDGVSGAGSDTYLVESSANILDVYAGGANALRVMAAGVSVTGTLSLNETVPAGITLNVFNASETGTTMGGNTLLRLASNASGADSTIQFTDSVVNNAYISGKSGHIYIQPTTAGISVADFSSTGLAVTGTLSASGIFSGSAEVRALGSLGVFRAQPTDVAQGGRLYLDTLQTVNTAARNWVLASNFSSYGDCVLRISTALGGDPVSAGTTILSASSTGLAVTGTLSATGNTGIGTASPNETGENANQRVLTIKGGAGTGNGFLELSNFSNASAGTLGGVKWVVNSTRVAGIDATGDGVNADSGSLRLYAKATGSSITTVATISSTGLAVTGTLSATGSGAVNSIAAFGATDFGALSGGANEVHIQHATNPLLVLGKDLTAYGFASYSVADAALYLQHRGVTNQIKLADTGLTTIGGSGAYGLAVTGTLSATGLLSGTAGVQFRGADATSYELLRVVGAGANNPGLFVKATEATKTVELFQSGSAGGEILVVGGIATYTSTALTLGSGVNLVGAGSLISSGANTVVAASQTVVDNSSSVARFIAFGPDAGTNATVRLLSVRSDGSGSVPYDFGPTSLTMPTGVNLVMASGQGIDFSATGNGNGTNIVEVLSDYEEGDFTPTLNAFTVTGTYTVTGKYMKVGRQVTVMIKLVVNTGTIACVAGTSYFELLPFTCGSISSAIGGVVDEATFIPLAGVYVPAGFTQIYPSAWGADANTRVISASYFV